VPDAGQPLAASGDADHARVPVRPAGRRPTRPRPHDGQRAVHGLPPPTFLADGRHGPGAQRGRRGRGPRTSRRERGSTRGFLDASDLAHRADVRVVADVWTGWGRSLALPGVEPRRRQLLDLAIVCSRRRCRCRGCCCGAATSSTSCSPPPASAPWSAPVAPTTAPTPPTGLSPLADPVAAVAIAAASRGAAARPGGVGPTAECVPVPASPIGDGGHGEAQPDEGHQHPGGGGPVRTLDDELDDGEGDEADPRGHGERSVRSRT
jgi:hypothetical protein